MDEPTNDLDAETLDLLEDLLMNYHGTLLLVSHDRAFLNNVATSTIVFDDDGQVREYVGGYDDWVQQRQLSKTTTTTKEKSTPKPVKSSGEKTSLTYQEQLDLEALPKQIEAMELKQAELHDKVSQADFYQQAADKVTAVQDQLTQLEEELELAYDRWKQLEAKQENA